MDIKRIIVWIFAVIPLLITILLLPNMADTVPAHYGLSGEVDRYDSKYVMLVFPLIIIAVIVLRDVMPRWIRSDDDTQQANIQVMDKMLLPIVLVLAGLNLLTLWLAYFQVQNIYTTSIDVPQLILGGLSVLFVVIGNLLPKTKPNHYVGIRMPWIINHPAVWYKTHRLGGVVMTAWGVVGLVVVLFVANPMVSGVVMLVGTMAMILMILVYSYIQYRRLIQRGHHE
ncbi:MAG: DUF1648 domain-containing protein [Roseiflexaceae bacterium]